jgi:hypothetical protein
METRGEMKEAKDMGAFSRRQKELLAAALLGPSIGFLSADALAQRTIERTLKVTGPVEIEAHTASEDLSVQAGPEGSVHIRCVVRPQNDSGENAYVEKAAEYVEANLPVRQEGNRISIERLGEPELLRHANLLYELTVPSNTKVTFNTAAGDFKVEGIHGPVEFNSASGDMSVRAVPESVRAHTSSGDVVLDESGIKGIEVSTQSGDVSVRLAANVGYDFSAHTSSGDFSIAHEMTLSPGDTKHDVNGKLRGGGAPLTIRTASGDIRIN